MKKSKGIGKAQPHVVVNALSNFRSRNMQFGNHKFFLDKSGMKHILERHHPNYWNGTTKAQQTFLNKNMSVNDVANAIRAVMNQNRNVLTSRGGVRAVPNSWNIQWCLLCIRFE